MRILIKIIVLFIVLASLLLGIFPKIAAAPVASANEVKWLQIEEIDPRYQKLNHWFNKYKCPEPRYVKEYIETADRYGIDYRLLPSISLKESTCGKAVPGFIVQGKWVKGACFNHWGWLIYGSNKKCFENVPAGIEEVLKNFGTNPKWVGTVDTILYRYNGAVESGYGERVKKLINQIN